MILKPQPIPTEARMLTYIQVAQMLQVGERTVTRLVEAGVFHKVRFGRLARIDRLEVESHIERAKNHPREGAA
jgi:excisionase family DNA binding protein